jgi:hypothetical protein
LSCPIHLRTETDPVSETLWDFFLSSTYKTMDKVQNKPNSSVQHKPSSESFQVYGGIASPRNVANGVADYVDVAPQRTGIVGTSDLSRK